MAQTDNALNLCKQQIAGMKRNKNRKGQYAPHKPILLLSIIDLVEVGRITSDTVELTPLLCQKFKELWDRYVPNGIQFNPDITKPFFHLSSEPFWRLVPRGCMGYLTAAESDPKERLPEPQYTQKYMRENYECARMDHSLFLFMQDHDSRVALRQVLHALLADNTIDTTFSGKTTTLRLNVHGNLTVRGDLMMNRSKKTVKQSVA